MAIKTAEEISATKELAQLILFIYSFIGFILAFPIGLIIGFLMATEGSYFLFSAGIVVSLSAGWCIWSKKSPVYAWHHTDHTKRN